jgi:hypothetical protein
MWMSRCLKIRREGRLHANPLRNRWLYAALGLYAAVFLLYSVTWAFTWDESFHLLAAQLIGLGKRPYLDFCFPQTPLNAYWNAAWMRLLGDHWRVPHAWAAVFTIGGVGLTARFTFLRFADGNWRTAAALTAALLTGLNATVFIFGPLAQAYGISLFTLVAAFQCTVSAVDRSERRWPAAAGFLAGCAAASTLLAAAATPVLLVWMLVYNRAGRRSIKVWAFAGGAILPFLPVMTLAWLGPRQAWFNLIEYHVFFRQLYWPGTTRHDLEILVSWIDSGQALLLGVLAAAGLLHVARRSEWAAAAKAEFYLCAWLAAALGAEAARAHPTFPRYFLLTVPFLAILGAVGVYAIAGALSRTGRPLGAVVTVMFLMTVGLGKAIYERREIGDWSGYERVARKIEEVTPRDALLFASQPMYFLTRRVPPPGFELSYSHKVDLGAAQNALLHILPAAEVKRQLRAGMFATAYSCDEEEMKDYGLADLYRRRADLEDCSVFWDRK